MPTAIEWTRSDDGHPGETLNPIRRRWTPDGKAGHACLKLSPGCDHCYAGRMQAIRFGGADYARESRVAQAHLRALVEAGSIYLDRAVLAQPLHWRRPRRIFVCSMTDLFGEWVPSDWQHRVFDVMAQAPQHTFLVLTKRPNVMRRFLTEDRLAWPLRPLPNVWLGVTVESDAYAWRAKVLAEVPAAVRFVSAEPLLGPLPSLKFDYSEEIYGRAEAKGSAGALLGRIAWVICGGESGGPPARRLVMRCPGHTLDRTCRLCDGTGWALQPAARAWLYDLRDRCRAAGVKFFYKQAGGPTPKAGGRLLDGVTWDEYPMARSVSPS